MQTEALAIHLKKYRKEARLTQEELANCVGVRRETISQLESGKGNPSLITGLKVAKVLNVPINEIFMLKD